MFDVIPITSEKQTDCGATCMQMLLAYYGQDVPLDTLIHECGTKVNGCSGGDLLRAARAHGLNDIIAYQMDAAEVARQDRPSIIWWTYNHWCICCGKNSNGDVVICNPDRGRFSIDPGSFASMYTGVAIFNGVPEDLPEPEYTTNELANAAVILLGMDEQNTNA